MIPAAGHAHWQPSGTRRVQCRCPVTAQQALRRQVVLLPGLAAALAAAAGGLAAAPRARARPAAPAPDAPPDAACELTTAPSGLQWCDLAVGTGPTETPGAFVKVHYVAKLAATGAVFDDTYAKRTPSIFKVGGNELLTAFDAAILGVPEEGLPPMRRGGRRRLVVPPGPYQRQGVKSLNWVVALSEAMEEAGMEVSAGGGPTSPLMFDLELLSKRGG